MMSLMVSTIAAGIKIPNFTTDLIMRILPEMLNVCNKTLGNNPVIAAERFYAEIQCALMANRKDDFLTIQQEPPFNKQGKINFISMLQAYNQGGVSQLRSTLEDIMKRGDQGALKGEPVKYQGGDGQSMEKAVVICTGDGDLGVAAEHWYLNYTYGRIVMQGQSLYDGKNGRYYDLVRFVMPSGETKGVYFDIHQFYPRNSSPQAPKSEISEPQKASAKRWYQFWKS